MVYPDIYDGTTEVYYISLVKAAGPGGSALFVWAYLVSMAFHASIKESSYFHIIIILFHYLCRKESKNHEKGHFH